MNNDYLDPINSQGMTDKADSLFALDFLLSVKNGVRNCAIALGESATPEAKTFLRNQLQQAVDLHEQVTDFMLNRGWLHPFDVNEQFKLDLIAADNTVKIANMQLFPDNTSRLGLFADLDH
jgi:similar to spore coat protein